MSTVMETNLTSPELQQDKAFQLFLAFCRKNNLFTSGDKVLVAISGGLDSTVLAHMLVRSAKILGIHVELAYVDHSQRQGAGQREAKWVGVFAERVDVSFHSRKLDVGPGASHEIMREARRSVLLDLASRVEAQKIATAHHADDNAETFVMRAISGSGVHGLRSMSPRDSVWVKPLLWATKEELRSYAKIHSLPWVEDPSNKRDKYLRNKVRKIMLDSLESARQGAVRSLSRTALRVEEEEAEIEVWISGQLETQSHDSTALSEGWLNSWPLALRRRVLRVWLKKIGLMPQPKLIETLLAGEEVVHAKGIFMKRSSMLVFIPEPGFGLGWEQIAELPIGKRISLGASSAWGFCSKAPESLSSTKHVFYMALKDPKNVLPGSTVLNWRSLPKFLCLVPASKIQDQHGLKEIFDLFRVPKPYRGRWPTLSDAQNPTIALALVGLSAIPRFEWKEEGPALVLQSFFEESLSTEERSC